MVVEQYYSPSGRSRTAIKPSSSRPKFLDSTTDKLIILSILENKEATSKQISESLHMSPKVIEEHLSSLKAQDVVKTNEKPKGKFLSFKSVPDSYSLTDKAIAEIETYNNDFGESKKHQEIANTLLISLSTPGKTISDISKALSVEVEEVEEVLKRLKEFGAKVEEQIGGKVNLDFQNGNVVLKKESYEFAVNPGKTFDIVQDGKLILSLTNYDFVESHKKMVSLSNDSQLFHSYAKYLQTGGLTNNPFSGLDDEIKSLQSMFELIERADPKKIKIENKSDKTVEFEIPGEVINSSYTVLVRDNVVKFMPNYRHSVGGVPAQNPSYIMPKKLDDLSISGIKELIRSNKEVIKNVREKLKVKASA
ncbi:MAG: helix-turn-helix transcriptional regulator [Candidatus Micrarchaeota archaeon]|nr:helix-turn-helix transcriptional regulator [Candidatus Micrarchaeota archaeon]